MQKNQGEIICNNCESKMRKKKKAKTSPTIMAPTSSWPGTSYSTTFTTSVSGEFHASRMGGLDPEEPVGRFVTYLCDKCGHEEIVEI